jgi:perosamine synthetase
MNLDAPPADDWIRLCEADLGAAELESVLGTLGGRALGGTKHAAGFERSFATYIGRAHGVSYASGTLGLLACLRALGVGPGDEVIATPYSWHQIAHAIAWAGATPVFADIDYWSGTVTGRAAEAAVTRRTRAIVAGNANGHPAPWRELRDVASRHGLVLIEDSTEAIGSVYLGRPVGCFGDCSIFDFSPPSALCGGDGAMVLTDDAGLASELRYLRERAPEDRQSVSVGSRVPLQARMSELSASLAEAQLARIGSILARRKEVEATYLRHMQSFEGIKPPYRAPEAEEVNWAVFLVHLGARFTRSARNHIIDDLRTEHVEAMPYCEPLHRQFAYAREPGSRARLPNVERIADRALALPFHAGLEEEQIEFIVRTAKDSSVNVGAGAAIY